MDFQVPTLRVAEFAPTRGSFQTKGGDPPEIPKCYSTMTPNFGQDIS